jgi:hypothetical protein
LHELNYKFQHKDYIIILDRAYHDEITDELINLYQIVNKMPNSGTEDRFPFDIDMLLSSTINKIKDIIFDATIEIYEKYKYAIKNN